MNAGRFARKWPTRIAADDGCSEVRVRLMRTLLSALSYSEACRHSSPFSTPFRLRSSASRTPFPLGTQV